MSETDGTPSSSYEDPSRVRGNGQAQQGNGHVGTNVWAGADQAGVAPPASPQGDPKNRPVPQNAYPEARAQAPAQQALSTSPGHNWPMAAQDAKRAALEFIQRQGDGASYVPRDLFDFMRKAKVIYLDENNQPVTFARVIVAWEN